MLRLMDSPNDPSPPPPPSATAQSPGDIELSLHDPYAALRIPDYLRYFVGNACSLLGTQMVSYTVGFDLYERTHSTRVLGLVGLAQIIPIVLLTLPAGHIADRFNRKHVVQIATFIQIVLFITAGFSARFASMLPFAHAASGWSKDPHVPILLALLVCNGGCRAVNQPAKASLLPMLVPSQLLSNAITWNSSLFELTNVAGPTIAGFIIAFMGEDPARSWGYSTVYWTYAILQIIQFINLQRVRLVNPAARRDPPTLKSILAGVRFVMADKIVLSVITLDLFAVLLGGATALLPAVADKILHIGAFRLGILRAAPSLGAITTALLVAHRPPMQHAGRNLLWAVTSFGTAIVVFGLSHNFWLSVAALIATGAFDNISVIVRASLVQLRTPDSMRGRVNAVNSVFIATSNELGAFESGYTASLAQDLWGPVAGLSIAIVFGGVGTILVVLGVLALWPQIGAVKKLEARE